MKGFKMNFKFALLFSILLSCSAVSAQSFQEQLTPINTLVMSGKCAEALPAYDKLIKTGTGSETENAMAYGFIAICHESLQQPDTAIVYYQKSVIMNVQEEMIYDRMFALGKKLKRADMQELALLQRMKNFPSSEKSMTKKLALLYMNSQKYDHVLSVAEKLCQWYPSNSRYFYFKGVALQNMKRTEEAEAAFNQAVKINPEDYKACRNLGLVLYNRASVLFDKEKEAYNKLQDPTRSDYLNYRRAIENGRSIYAQAEPLLVKAYAKEPHPHVKKALFNLYVRLEENEKAAAYKE